MNVDLTAVLESMRELDAGHMHMKFKHGDDTTACMVVVVTETELIDVLGTMLDEWAEASGKDIARWTEAFHRNG